MQGLLPELSLAAGAGTAGTAGRAGGGWEKLPLNCITIQRRALSRQITGEVQQQQR